MDDTPIGTLAADATPVRVFEVSRILDGKDLPDVLVLAHDIEEAQRLYLREHQVKHDADGVHLYRTAEISRWTLLGDHAELRRLADNGETGVAVRGADGWQVECGGQSPSE
jgi:hypothetical protein